MICEKANGLKLSQKPMESQIKDWPAKKVTIFNSIVHLVKTSENILVFLPAFYLIMWLMKSPKNFEKIALLKI